MFIKIDCTVKKMSKMGNMESKKQFKYVNPTIWSDTHVVFCLCSLSTF